MDQTALHQIKSLLSEQTGLRILDENINTLACLAQDRMKAFKLSSLADYYQLLSHIDHPELAGEHEFFSRGLTTGETYFFRDQGQMKVLSQSILPELIERNRGQRSLRFWSAGCSTGEEAYSLAILLDELPTDLSDWRISILGTDINREALAKAQQATYSEWSFRQVDRQRQQRYFRLHWNRWELDPRIRRQVRFRPFNLVTEMFPEIGGDIDRVDLILCRNVFIYLEPGKVKQIADKMTAALVEGGYLMTGHSELYAHHLGGLRTRVYPDSIVYQKKPHLTRLPHPSIHDQPEPVPLKNNDDEHTPPAKQAAFGYPNPTVPVTAQATVTMQDAWTFANQGRPEQALSCCEILMAKSPLDHNPYYLTALLAQEQGNTEKAKTLLKKVIYLAPEFISAYLELGDIHVKENNPALARKMWSTARNLLQLLPQDKYIEMFGNSTASDILQFVNNRLAELE